MVRDSYIVRLIRCSTLHCYTGIHHLCDNIGCATRWSRRRCHVRLDRSPTRSRHRRCHLHWWCHRASCLSYSMEHGERPVPRSPRLMHIATLLSVLDRRPFLDWHRRWPRILHCATLHPRTLPHASPGPHGGPQRRYDHPRTSHRVRNRRRLCEREWRVAMDGWIGRCTCCPTACRTGVPT